MNVLADLDTQIAAQTAIAVAATAKVTALTALKTLLTGNPVMTNAINAAGLAVPVPTVA